MASEHRVWEKKPTKDGRNAKQRRADKKRAIRLASAPHIETVAAALKKQRYLQSQRWVDHNMRTGDILGYQNEIRWGLRTGNTRFLSDEAQSVVERFERQRWAALDCLNRGRKAAGLSAVALVDDWFGQAVTGGVAGTGDSTVAGAETGIEERGGGEMDMGDEEGKKTEGEGEEEGDDSDCMSGVEMGGFSL